MWNRAARRCWQWRTRICTDPACAYEWFIQRLGDGGVLLSATVDYNATVTATFEEPNSLYFVSVTERSVRNSAAKCSERSMSSSTVVSKDVRREIRDLTYGDRERYLFALATMFSLSQEEGEARYGSNFLSHAHLTSLHASTIYEYHGNLAFLTSHPSFQLKLGRTLQQIDPGVDLP